MKEIRVLAMYGDSVAANYEDWYDDYESAFRRAGEIRAEDPCVPILVDRRNQEGTWTHHYYVQGAPLGGY